MPKLVHQNIAIILAAGKSLRMQGVDKIETIVGGKPLITYTLQNFLDSKLVHKIIIACNEENSKALKKIFPEKKFKKISYAFGGETRFQSAKNAYNYALKIFSLSEKSTILFHNSGNVMVTKDEIDETIRRAKKMGACIVARPATDTLKKISLKEKSIYTIDRKEILHAETPQTFRVDVLKKAYKQPMETTDESSLVEQSLHTVEWIPASTFNRKITTQHDIAVTKMLLEKEKKQVRHGIGTDTHFFEKGSKKYLTLCGIVFKKYGKLKADSDGDVALHSIATALSQAISGGSLGTFATDMYKKEKITDSTKYIKKILDKVEENNFALTHLGIHFETNIPKIDPIAEKLKISLSKILGIHKSVIGITATTGEKESIRCISVVTIS